MKEELTLQEIYCECVFLFWEKMIFVSAAAAALVVVRKFPTILHHYTLFSIYIGYYTENLLGASLFIHIFFINKSY